MKQKYKLKVGDVIYVDNPLLKEEYRRYEVEKIIGNRAITKFRDFNTEIYFNNRIYEWLCRTFDFKIIGASAKQNDLEES